MRIRIHHLTTYAWRTPAKSIIQVLRLTPRNHDGQRVNSWRIDPDVDHSLKMSEDAYANLVHTISIDGPLSRLTVSIDGDVETFDTAGVLRGSIERFPPQFYLRDTPHTEARDLLREFARDTVSGIADTLGKMHALMGGVADIMKLDPEAAPEIATAGEAFGRKSGASQDLAQAFIAAARHVDTPARFVSGYYFDVESKSQANAAHGWAEAWIEGLGWVGFDPAHCICPTEGHVSVARALDYLGASPVRASRSGGDGEEVDAQVRVSQQQDQRQS